MYSSSRSIATVTLIAALLPAASWLHAASGALSGTVTDPQGRPVAGAMVTVAADLDAKTQEAGTDRSGAFTLAAIAPGSYKITAASPEFADVSRTLTIAESNTLTISLQFERLTPRSDSVTVTATRRWCVISKAVKIQAGGRNDNWYRFQPDQNHSGFSHHRF